MPSIYSCGYDRSNTTYDYAQYNTEQILDILNFADPNAKFYMTTKLLEALFITDSVPRFLKRYLSDAFSLYEYRSLLTIKTPFIENVDLNDPNAVLLVNKRLQEILDSSDYIKKEIYCFLPTENITFDDKLTRLTLLSIIDFLNLLAKCYAAPVIKLNEVMNFVGTVIKDTKYVIEENLNPTDVCNKTTKKRITEAINLIDTYTKILKFIIKTDLQFQDIEPEPYEEINWLYSALLSSAKPFIATDSVDGCSARKNNGDS